jgi:flagellin-specific chaperone FliS
MANLSNDATILDEVLILIDTLRSAWAQIAGTTMPVAVGG